MRPRRRWYALRRDIELFRLRRARRQSYRAAERAGLRVDPESFYHSLTHATWDEAERLVRWRWRDPEGYRKAVENVSVRSRVRS